MTECFVKRENSVACHSSVDLPLLKSRAIQSSEPYINDSLGPVFSLYTKTLESHNSVNRFFCYTTRPDQVAALIAEHCPEGEWLYCSMDFSAADASVSPYVYDLVEADLLHLDVDPAIVEEFNWCRRIKGTTTHKVQYKNSHGLASGRPFTTAIHSRASIEAWERTCANVEGVYLFHKSDDHLVICRPDLVEYVEKFYHACRLLGYSLTQSRSHYLHHAEFLSLRFYRVNDRVYCTPKIGRTMSKLFYTHQPTKIGDPHS